MDGASYFMDKNSLLWLLNNLRKLLGTSLLILGLLSQSSWAGVVVVVHPSVDAGAIDASQVSNIFLGKSNKLPSGNKITPIDQEEGEAPRDTFYLSVVKKDASQLNAYWSRLIFTGKGQPPKAVLDDDEVVELVASDPSVIGYISSEAVDDSVKVILEVK